MLVGEFHPEGREGGEACNCCGDVVGWDGGEGTVLEGKVGESGVGVRCEGGEEGTGLEVREGV